MSDTAGAAADDAGQQAAADAAAAAAANADDKGDGADTGQQAANGDDKGSQAADSDAGADTGKAADPDAADWRDGIADEKLAKFAKGYNSVEELVKSAHAQRQKLSKALVLPGEDASDDELREWRTKLGVPESADKYRIDIPEDLPDAVRNAITPEAMQSDLEMAHALGLSQDQTAGLMQYRIESLVDADAVYDASLKRAQEQADGELRREWGDDYKANRAVASRAAQEFGGDEFVDFLAKTVIGGEQLANHPKIMRFMASTGRKMLEASVHLGHGSEERQGLEERRDALTAQIHDARDAGDSQLAAKLDRERNKLTTDVYGTGDIVGAGNRST